MPKFSVIIPTYNRSSEVKRSIESVLAQTITDYEILVMDDGSTDNTEELVSAFNDKRIIYEWDTNFGGPARPRNRGLRKAKAEWICFLDADDWWMPNKLQVCSEYTKDNVDLIYHDLQIVSKNSSFLKSSNHKSRKLTKPVLFDLLVHGNPISNSSVVVRKNLFEQIGWIDENPEMIAGEDFNTWLRIAQITDKFCYIPKTLGYYLLHEQGISRKNMSATYKSATADFIGALNVPQRNNLNAYIAYLSGRHHYTRGMFKEAYKELLVCLKLGSFAIRAKSLYLIIMLFIKNTFKNYS